jgi:DNA polymerase III alpha subunit
MKKMSLTKDFSVNYTSQIMNKTNQIIPLFYDDSSGKSINTWIEPDKEVEGGPASIIRLVKDLGLTQCVFISSTFYPYMTALNLCQKHGIQLIFGLEIPMCPNRLDHSEESVRQNHKVIILGKNSQSYYDLIKLYTAYKTDKDAKYYKYRCDDELLGKYWTDNLILGIPFFDSFIANNLLVHNSNIIPKFPSENLILFQEQGSEHPHEELINGAIDRFNSEGKHQEIKTKTIFYENRVDSKPWLVYRGVLHRASYHKPEMDYCCSDSFCVENYRELTS